MRGSRAESSVQAKASHRGWTYARAGVDLSKVRRAHHLLQSAFATQPSSRSQSLARVMRGPGHYAGLIGIGKNSVLALHADGVGTKVLVAQMMGKFDTIGIDCIAMNVNDLICVGAEPLAFVDYIALKEANERLVAQIAKGLMKGAGEAGVAIVGGETAVLPGIITGKGRNAFDLAGMAVGIASKNRLVTGSALRKGDAVVGIESSGLHSNGYTLARRVLLARHRLTDRLAGLQRSLGEELLEPTMIYVKPILELLRRDARVTGLAHITGGAFTKLRRLSPRRRVGFDLNNMPEPPSIFKAIMKQGSVSKKEMYRTFNMGVGFCIATRSSETDGVLTILRKHNFGSHVIGTVTDEPAVRVEGLRVA